MVRELIRVDDIYRSFGPVNVLQGVSVRIDEGDRIGIIGHNGSGKTTLLNTISERNPDMGDVIFTPGLRIAYLTQIRDIDDDATLEMELGRKGRQFEELDGEIAELEAAMADPVFYEGDWQGKMDRYQELQALSAKSGGANVSTRASGILDALGLSHHPMDTPLSSLSGGERAKVALARQLVGLSQIEVLFLDEPTNHLDLQTLDWLEDFLADYEGSLVMVSHDRYFLDRTCNHILDVHNGHVKGYKGNYSAYLQQKELFMQTLEDRIAKAEKEVKRITGALQSMKRANKYDKSISQKHFMLMRQQRQLKWMKSLRPKRRKGLAFSLSSTDKSSLDVLELRNASLTFDGLERPLMKEVFAAVSRGQKIGIVGANGVGKTTLLRTLIGDVQLDEGEVEVQPGAEIGYFHQDHRTLDFNLTPVEQVQRLKPRMEYGDIRAMLGKFQLNKDQVETKLKSLSGGERARIALLKLLLEDNNLLLLDEPTNHLDTDAREAVEEAFKEYEGSIIIVSHDRWFLDAICDTIWHLPGDGSLNIYPGNYSHVFRK
jgi:ATP-binding cassette subfamily F protein 3